MISAVTGRCPLQTGLMGHLKIAIQKTFPIRTGFVFRGRFSKANLRVSCESRTRLAWLETRYLCRSVKDTLRRAPSGSRTRTSAMARRQAAATSWVHKTGGLYAVHKTNSNNWLCTPAEPHQQYPLQSHLCKKCFRVVIFKDQRCWCVATSTRAQGEIRTRVTALPRRHLDR